MKLAFGWLLAALLLLSPTPAARSAARASSPSRAAGRDYVRLSEWAARYGMGVRWTKKDESLQVSNQNFRILLNVDSTEAQINGVGVRLCFPVAAREGVPSLSVIDARSTFEPILNPPKPASRSAVKTICLDAGHGGNDPGNLGRGSQEKKYTLLLAQELRDQLTRAGFKVVMTRTRDTNVELDARAEFARRRGADLLLSLHFNAAPSSASIVRGAEVYCMTPAGAPSSNARGEGSGSGSYPGNRLNDKNMFLAYQMQKSLLQKLGTEDRGVHRARFAVLREAVMPAVLIEAGFLSHPVEGRKITDAAYRRQIARAILEGVVVYKRPSEPRA